MEEITIIFTFYPKAAGKSMPAPAPFPLTALTSLRYNSVKVGGRTGEPHHLHGKGGCPMAHVRKKSVLPIYLIGVVWLAWAVFGSLSRPVDYLLAALVSAAAYFLGKMIFPDRGYDLPGSEPDAPQETSDAPRQQAPAQPTSTGNPEIDQLVAERDRALSEMRRLNDTIEDPLISDQIDHLELVTEKIIGAVVEKPAKLPQLRRFLHYYLPTTLKLLNAYDRMDAAGVSGTNIDGAKGKIEQIMGAICQAFDKQLDALYGVEALDISTDIAVLENLLAQEGLAGPTLPPQE